MDPHYTDIAIIGYGVTGKATGQLFDKVDTYDKDHKEYSYHDNVIICLPTPTVDGEQDLSVIREWLGQIRDNALQSESEPIVILRSTVLPGTTEKLANEFGLNMAHVPEFLTESSAIDDAFNPELLVIGAKDILTRFKVYQLFTLASRMVPKKVIQCSTSTSELIKYAMNSFFALKVIMGNQLWDTAKTSGADYEKVREALENHKWGSKNGWDVWYGGFRGYAGKCLPKDLEAFTWKYDLPLLETVRKINSKLLRKNK